jgi:hypothetical protein
MPVMVNFKQNGGLLHKMSTRLRVDCWRKIGIGRLGNTGKEIVYAWRYAWQESR